MLSIQLRAQGFIVLPNYYRPAAQKACTQAAFAAAPEKSKAGLPAVAAQRRRLAERKGFEPLIRLESV
jgi:hypothetical protein